MFLIPLRVDVYQPRLPLVNYGLIGVIVLVSVLGFLSDDLVKQLAHPGHDYPAALTAVTCIFLHNGVLHLVGNLLFLWVFGNAINSRFGHVRYLVLFLLAGWAGTMLHYGLDGRPAVGASGAINGVMAAFLLYYPRNEVDMALVTLWRYNGENVHRFDMSSGWIIAFWAAWDVFFLAVGAHTRVAVAGHVGGFLTGLGLSLACLLTNWVRPSQDEESLLATLGIREDVREETA